VSIDNAFVLIERHPPSQKLLLRLRYLLATRLPACHPPDHFTGLKWEEKASACFVRNDGAALGKEQGFGVFLGDGEEFQGGLAGAAGALFPASDDVGA